MSRMIKILLIFACLLLLLTTASVHSFHQNRSLDDNRYAVVWGQSGYRGEPIAGDNNGRLMAHLLVHEYGMQSSHICSLIGSKLTWDSAYESLQWLKEQTDSDSQVFFFYAGHGSPNGTYCFMHYNLNLMISEISFDKLCIVIWSCYSGNAAEALSGENRLTIGSRPVGMTEVGSGGKSLFGRYFLDEGIKQGLADANLDGIVSMQEAYYYYHNKNPYLYGTISDNIGEEFIP